MTLGEARIVKCALEAQQCGWMAVREGADKVRKMGRAQVTREFTSRMGYLDFILNVMGN